MIMTRTTPTSRLVAWTCVSLFLFLFLSPSTAAVGARESKGSSFASTRHLRSTRGVKGDSQNSNVKHRRSLKSKLNKKQPPVDRIGGAGGEHTRRFLRRVVVHCDTLGLPAGYDLDQCWTEVTQLVSNAQLVHHLKSLNALAVELDESSIDDLIDLGVWMTDDVERRALWVEDSLQYLHSPSGRNLFDSEQSLGYHLDLTRVTDVWEQYQVKGEGVKVCIMDTGVNAAHPDLNASRLTGWNFTEDFVVPWNQDLAGHGTHITGVVAAADNNRGFVGVAPGVEVYFVRVFTNEGNFFGSDVVAAAYACQQAGSDIISMSLGGEGSDDGEYEAFRDLYLNHGILAVASAGNTGGPELTFPAGYDHVLSVAACDDDRNLAGFSSFNSFVDIAAPGVNIPSTYIDSTAVNPEPYATLSGTSMAAPQVAGILALMKSFARNATADELIYALTESTQSLATNVHLGLVDALAAIQLLESDVDLSLVTPQPCLDADLEITTDWRGEDTAYRLRRLSDKAVLWHGRGLVSNMDYIESTCVNPNDCYEFVIKDSYGDGIVHPGGFHLMYNGQIEWDGGDFGLGGKIFFGDAC